MKNEHTYQRMIGVCLFVAHRTLRFSLYSAYSSFASQWTVPSYLRLCPTINVEGKCYNGSANAYRQKDHATIPQKIAESTIRRTSAIIKSQEDKSKYNSCQRKQVQGIFPTGASGTSFQFFTSLLSGLTFRLIWHRGELVWSRVTIKTKSIGTFRTRISVFDYRKHLGIDRLFTLRSMKKCTGPQNASRKTLPFLHNLLHERGLVALHCAQRKLAICSWNYLRNELCFALFSMSLTAYSSPCGGELAVSIVRNTGLRGR